MHSSIDPARQRRPASSDAIIAKQPVGFTTFQQVIFHPLAADPATNNQSTHLVGEDVQQMISATFTALAKLVTSVAECALRIVYLIGGWGTETEIVRFRRYAHAPRRIPTTKLCNPYRELSRRRIADHSARMRRVPDDVRTIRANLDARRDPICGRFQSRQMLEDEVPAAARGLMRSSLWKSVVVLEKPLVPAASQVDVDTD